MNERITKFNHITGKAPLGFDRGASKEDIWKQIEDQVERVYEEAKEMRDAARERNLVEVLDGHLDTWYTNSYIQDLLQAINVDVKGAKVVVVENNDSKYTTSREYAEISARIYLEDDIDVYIDPYVYDNVLYYTVKRVEDNKVMKLKDHQRPELEKYVPDEWK